MLETLMDVLVTNVSVNVKHGFGNCGNGVEEVLSRVVQVAVTGISTKLRDLRVPQR
jgi:hypothetical protein